MLSAWNLLWIIPLTMFLTIFCMSLAYAASDFENYNQTDEKEELINEQRNDMEESEK